MTDNRIFFPNTPIVPAKVAGLPDNKNAQAVSGQSGGFQQVLNQEVSGLKFSQHAMQRLGSRNIQLSAPQLTQLKQAVDKAAEKGSRDSLVLLNKDLALVVSVTNRTVITAMDGSSIRDNVFTNIDSAIIV